MRRGRYPVRGAPVMAAHASGPIAYGIYTYQLSMDWRDTPGLSGHDVHFTDTPYTLCILGFSFIVYLPFYIIPLICWICMYVKRFL